MKIDWFAVWMIGGGLLSSYLVKGHPSIAYPLLSIIMLVGYVWLQIEIIDVESWWERKVFEIRMLKT